MNKWLLGIAVLLLFGCGSKEAGTDTSTFFPVLSFIKSQVSHVDSTALSIMKIETSAGRSDTVYVKREQFKALANDFLTIPDITEKGNSGNYKETHLYDQELKRVVLNYTPKNPEAEIRRQEVFVEPDDGSGKGDQVQTIFIERHINTRDSTVQKKLLWQVNKRFQIATIIQKKNEPEKVQKIQVIWNDFPSGT